MGQGVIQLINGVSHIKNGGVQIGQLLLHELFGVNQDGEGLDLLEESGAIDGVHLDTVPDLSHGLDQVSDLVVDILFLLGQVVIHSIDGLHEGLDGRAVPLQEEGLISLGIQSVVLVDVLSDLRHLALDDRVVVRGDGLYKLRLNLGGSGRQPSRTQGPPRTGAPERM